jgi:hypothetical protein
MNEGDSSMEHVYELHTSNTSTILLLSCKTVRQFVVECHDRLAQWLPNDDMSTRHSYELHRQYWLVMRPCERAVSIKQHQ